MELSPPVVCQFEFRRRCANSIVAVCQFDGGVSIRYSRTRAARAIPSHRAKSIARLRPHQHSDSSLFFYSTTSQVPLAPVRSSSASARPTRCPGRRTSRCLPPARASEQRSVFRSRVESQAMSAQRRTCSCDLRASYLPVNIQAECHHLSACRLPALRFFTLTLTRQTKSHHHLSACRPLRTRAVP